MLLAATLAGDAQYRRDGVAPAPNSAAAMLEQVGGTELGTMLPLALHAVSLLLPGSTSRLLSGAASARQPDVSLHFARSGRTGDRMVDRPDLRGRFTGTR